jgi:hypothetical protein
MGRSNPQGSEVGRVLHPLGHEGGGSVRTRLGLAASRTLGGHHRLGVEIEGRRWPDLAAVTERNHSPATAPGHLPKLLGFHVVREGLRPAHNLRRL